MSFPRAVIAAMGMVGCMAMAVPAASQTATSPGAAARSAGLSCDNSIVERFKPNAQTKVLLVKQYRKGDVLTLEELPWIWVDKPKQVEADICLVKLLVGPGNPGPAGAPSTSAGIGIDVWLPAKGAWNGRIHALGTGGFGGGTQSDVTKVALSYAPDFMLGHILAAREGSVISSTDTGHPGYEASFAMNPDGSFNKALWTDYSSRATHQQAILTKTLATAYYGQAPKFSYFEGGSGGGRQALLLAQRYPDAYDGIIAAYPAVNFLKFLIVSNLYPRLVMERDLGGKYLSEDQIDLASNAAIAACDVVDGKHLGFILRPETCRYDPTKDTAVLCATSGGKNQSKSCLTPQQALVMNKIWYGMTSDGSVPDPAIDNGFGPLTGKRRWYSIGRGTSLKRLVPGEGAGRSSTPPLLAALALYDPTIPTGTGANGWRSMSYQKLSDALDIAEKHELEFASVDTNDPDLSAFKRRGGKLIQYHGTDDTIIPYLGSVDYYKNVVARMGGLDQVQDFYRFYTVLGMGHGAENGTTNPGANPPMVGPAKNELFKLLTDWVENGRAPNEVILESASGSPVRKSLPACAYPAQVTYVNGDIYAAASYACR